MELRNKTQAEISSLEYLAIKYYEADMTDEEIRRNDVGPYVWQEIDQIIENKELINWAITGRVTSGKSTVDAVLTQYINEEKLGKKMDLEYICADQYEFGRKTLKDYTAVCFMVDEFSALETTGWNSTVEEKYLEQFSDVQAQRYLHRVSCSPKRVQDQNVDVIFQVLNKNIKAKTTTCLVYYRMFSPNGERIQLIGHMVVDVSGVIDKPWYKRYRERKMRKMQLVYKEGIFRMRDMHFAEVVLKAYKSLEVFTSIMRPNRDIIEGKIKRELQEAKIPITSLAIEHIKSETASVLGQKIAAETFWKHLKKTGLKSEDRENMRIGYKEAMSELQRDVDRYKKLVAINREYEAI